MEAAKRGRAGFIDQLADKGGDVKTTDTHGMAAIHYAAMSKSADAVQALLTHGADAHVKTKQGVTALIFSAWFGDINSIKVLLDAGADPNVIDNQGNTALNYAINRSRSDNVIALIEKAGGKKAEELSAGKAIRTSETIQ